MAKYLAPLLLLLIALPALASAATLAAPNTSALASGLAGYWPLDGDTTSWTTGTTYDLSGNSKNGSMVSLSTSTTPVSGMIGQAFNFGVSQGIRSSLPTTATDNVTMSVWVYFTNASSDQMIAYLGNASTNGWGLILSNGACGAGTKVTALLGGTNCDALSSTYSLSKNTWTHLVLVRRSGTWYLYVDGTLQKTGGSTTPSTPTIAMGIHSDNTTASATSFGKIDDVRVYSRALSATEIALLFASGRANIGVSAKNALTSGLVGYWPFDGNTTNWTTGTTLDLSGNSNSGSLSSMATTTSPIPGRIGQALSFNGTSQTVQVPSAASLQGLTTISVSAWIRTTNTQGGSREILRKGNGASSWFLLLNSANKIAFTSSGASGEYSNGILYPTDNAWHLVTATFDGSTIRIYLDGALKISYTGAALASNTDPLSLGSLHGASQFFPGSIDDARIYGRALSATEVAQLYAVGIPATIGHSVSANPGGPLSSGLVGYWTFDGPNMNWKTGTALDSSGSGNNGTLVKLSTTTSPTQGKIGQALKFNGTTTASYISLGTPGSLDISGDMTIVAWIRPTFLYSSTGAKNPIITARTTSSVTPYDLGVYTTGIEMDMHLTSGGDGNGFQVSHFATAIPLNQWTQVVVTRTSSTLSAYKNGTLVSSTAMLGSVDPTSNGVQIGKDFYDTTYYFNGSIDDVRVYNRALSSTEVSQLYQMSR